MSTSSLAGKRIVVVGASAGIGRAFATQAIADGAQVVVAARNEGALTELTAAAGEGTAVVADIRNPEDCDRVAAIARDRLGEIDLLLTSAGYARLRMLQDTTVEDWRAVLDVNVIGTHQLIRSCLPAMAPSGFIAALSSESVGHPWAALGSYASSKAALEHVLHSWRTEHPGYRFCCVVVGSTVPTEFGASFEPEVLDRAILDWTARGLTHSEFMATDELADVLCGIFGAAMAHSGIGLDHLVLKSPSAVVTSAQHVIDYAFKDERSPLSQ